MVELSPSLVVPASVAASGEPLTPKKRERVKRVPIDLVAPPNTVPKRVSHQKAIEKAERRLYSHLYHYIKKLEELAEGVVVMQEDKATGTPSIYKRAPDRQALTTLIERAMGAVPKTLDFTDGGAIIIPWMPSRSDDRGDDKSDNGVIEGEYTRADSD